MANTEMLEQMGILTIKCVGWTTAIATAIATPLVVLAYGGIVFERAHIETNHQKRMKDIEYEMAAEELRRMKLTPLTKPLEQV